MKLQTKIARRFLLGGLCGLAVMVAAACVLEFVGAGIRGVFHFPTLAGHGAEERFGSYGLAVFVQSVLVFALGGMAGLATLPFAEDGKTLLRRSALHFAVTALLFALLLALCFDVAPDLLPAWVFCLLALYLVIWLARWVGWYAEVSDIREKLGLAPEPSPLKWRETIPYFAFALLVCCILPALLWRICGAMLGSILNYLILSAGCFCSGLSLGKRQGFCPLYPPFCGLVLWPVVGILYHIAPSICLVPALSALAGNAAGALHRRLRRRRTEPPDAAALGLGPRKKGRTPMKQTRLYNVIFPIWMFLLFPPVWLIILPGNLIIDCGVLLIVLAALKHGRKLAVLKELWCWFWLLGFAADFVGMAVLLAALIPGALLSGPAAEWWSENLTPILYNAFQTPAAFLWTLAGVAAAGVCIYFFDKRAMRSCDLLTDRQKHIIALTMAIATAPWTFFIVMY